MENCYVTKLKCVIDNTNLFSPGEVKIKFTPTTGSGPSINSSSSSKFVLTDTTTLKLTGDCTFKKASDTSIDLGKTVTLDAYNGSNTHGVQLYANSISECELTISPIYNVIANIGDTLCGGFPGLIHTSEIKYLRNIFKLMDFKAVQLDECTISDYKLNDVLTESLVDFSWRYCQSEDDVSIFGNYKNLRTIGFQNAFNLYGTFESIVEGFASSGLADGATVSIRFNNNENISFHNVKGVGSLPYTGLITVERSGNSFTVTQSSVVRGTYTIGSGWVYTD